MLAIILLDIVDRRAQGPLLGVHLGRPAQRHDAGGIFPAIFGTVALTLLMTVAAVPAGVATAIFLTEYAPPNSKLARAIRVCIANLAGVPSIVFGLFGLGFFIATVGKSIDRAFYDGKLVYGKPSLIWASLTLGDPDDARRGGGDRRGAARGAARTT